MPVTPIITVTQPIDNPPRLRVMIDNGVSTIVANSVWRATPTENEGLPQLITNLVPDDGMFDDFNIASGITYSYYVVADDGSTTATSLTHPGSVTLHNAVLHAVTKNSSTSNALASGAGSDFLQLETGEFLELESGGESLELDGGGGYSLDLLIYDQSHSRAYRNDSTLHLLSNASGPRIGLSAIEEGSITIPAIIPKRSDQVRQILRTAYLSRAMLCLRTALGDKWFGRLSSFREQPSGINFLFNFTFEILDFSESVA